ncbi:MAG: FHA domain-containing protein [Chloroflexi bacterium]|nr:FHA domain-containing protein [Chloroflexota bacterium]
MTVLSRLDILHPDGRSASYVLDLDEITIGSAAGNSIQVSDASLAARHIRLSRRNNIVYLTSLDALHLTMVDGEPAPVNEPQPLREVCHIRAGQLRIVFNQSSDEPTVPMGAISDATQPTAARFHARLETGNIKVWQFSAASTSLSVYNLGDNDGLFRLEMSGLPSEWTSPNHLTFSVAGSDAVDLLLQVKPTRIHDCAPGEYPLIITIRQLDGGQESVQLVLLVEVGGVGGLSAALDAPRLRTRDPFNLVFLNLGNEELALQFSFHDPGQQIRVKLAQDSLRLKAGERAIISARAEPRRRPLLGKPHDHSFALLAKARAPCEYVVALPATIVVKPILDYRALVAAAISTVILILALAALLHQPPQPAIESFTASEETVAQGNPVELSWSAAEALSFVIEVNELPIAELPGDNSSYTLNTHGFVDPIDIRLLATNGNATDTASLRVNIFQPVIIRKFEADKSSLLRILRNDLTISWNIEGAVALDIALPVGFETVQRQIAGDGVEIVIVGAPADDFEIILTAEDEIGGKTTRAIPITIRDPECTPIQDTLLYTGPDSRFERANYAVENVPVLARGVNAAANWLQVELATGEIGWGFHSNFRCHGFDPASLNVVSDIPLQPTATPALTQTPIATATSIPSLVSTQTPAATSADS